ncbi:hypothetical protein [Streptomyces sp. NPDC004296]|uniref:hypothetical protein n=1 Tax=Streptomyces sp. NPDC004296 TaxID=3364697 RepID=UPI0036B91292
MNLRKWAVLATAVIGMSGLSVATADTADASAQAAAPTGHLVNWSCGYAGGNGLAPGHSSLSRVTTDRGWTMFGPDVSLTVELRNGWSASRGRWFAWARVTAPDNRGGAFVVTDWSDGAGRTYHRCCWGNRPSYVAKGNSATYTRAVDWVRGRSVRVCAGAGGDPRSHQGGTYIGCSPWHLN